MQQKRQSKRIINYILLLQLPLLLSIAITACGGGGDSPSVFNGDVTPPAGTSTGVWDSSRWDDGSTWGP